MSEPIEEFSVAQIDAMKKLGSITTDGATWLLVLSYLCLARRCPGIEANPTAKIIDQFIHGIGVALCDQGCLTQAQLAALHEWHEADRREGECH